VLHVANGVVALGVLGLAASVMLGVARACGAMSLLWLPEPWFPTALCLDGGGLPICIDLGAGECALAMTAVMGAALVFVGLIASAVITWQLLLFGAQSVLSQAQHMVGGGGGGGGGGAFAEGGGPVRGRGARAAAGGGVAPGAAVSWLPRGAAMPCPRVRSWVKADWRGTARVPTAAAPSPLKTLPLHR
jgi:hypothetical protein